MFGFSLAVTVDGEEQHGAGDEEELAPLPLGSLRVALRGGAPAGAAALPRGARGRGASLTAAAAAISRVRGQHSTAWTAQHSVHTLLLLPCWLSVLSVCLCTHCGV